jgi:integrase
VGRVYLTALTLGLREGELLGLKWSDVDFASRTLRVNQTVQRIERVRTDDDQGAKTSLQFVETKTDRSRRVLSLSDSLIKALRLHRARQSQERLAAGSDWHDLGLVFATLNGTPIEKSNLYRHFKTILDDSKLPSIRFHDLRHSTASLLLAQGTSPRVIMDLLGHSKISTTMDTYAHVMPAMMQAAADSMDLILASK